MQAPIIIHRPDLSRQFCVDSMEGEIKRIQDTPCIELEGDSHCWEIVCVDVFDYCWQTMNMIQITKGTDAELNYGFRNLRILILNPVDISIIDNCSIEISTQMDIIYPSISGDLIFRLFDNGRIIPALKYHEMRFRIKCNRPPVGGILLEYERIKIKNLPNTSLISTSFMFHQNIMVGGDCISNGICNTPLYFGNGPIDRIRIYSSTRINNLSICYISGDSKECETIVIPIPTEWIIFANIRLDPPINFSSITSAYLTCTADACGTINVLADKQQIMRMVSGMAGCVF